MHAQDALATTKIRGSGLFVSYSGPDRAIATAIARRLEAAGFESYFLDFDPEHGIPPGRDWSREIYRQIKVSDAVLVVHSAHAAASKWCFAELTQAIALGKEIIPLQIDDAELGPQLASRQAIDARQDVDEACRVLLRSLRDAGVDPDDDFAWPRHRDPYPGLNLFTQADAGIYFGRHDLIRESLDVLNQLANTGRRFALVHGASGTGKSSLVHAGLLPRLQKPGRAWHPLPPMRPRTAPLEALAQALASVAPYPEWKALYQKLTAGGDATDDDGARDDAAVDAAFRALAEACADARVAAGRPQASVLLVVDQFEEALAADVDRRETMRFHRLLRKAVESTRHDLFVLAALRSDFLGTFQNHPVWSSLESRPLTIGVGPLPRSRFPLVIEGPAARVGMTLEPGLVQSLVLDAANDDALPLLALTMRELYLRCKDTHHMTVAVYERDLGGMQGVVKAVIERITREAGDDRVNWHDVRRAFLQLVHVTSDGRFARVSARADAMPAGAATFLERCVQNRVLSVRVEGDVRMIEVAHESLFRVWDDLARWLEEDRAFLRFSQRLRVKADEWREEGRPVRLLDRESALHEARKWLGERPEDLSELQRGFIQASAEEAERATREELARQQRELDAQREIRAAAEARAEAEAKLREEAQRLVELKTVAAARAARSARTTKSLLLVVTALAILAAIIAGVAVRERSKVEARGLGTQARALLGNDQTGLDGAALVAAESLLRAPVADGRSAAVAALDLLPIIGARRDLPAGLHSVRESEGGRYLAAIESASGNLVLFTVSADGVVPAITLAAERGGLDTFAFDTNDAFVVAYDRKRHSGGRGLLRVWNLATRTEVARRDLNSWPGDFTISPDGAYVASTGAGLNLWRVEGGTLIDEPRSGSFVSTPPYTQLGPPSYTMELGYVPGSSIAFSPDGRRLAVGRRGEHLYVFDFPSMTLVAEWDTSYAYYPHFDRRDPNVIWTWSDGSHWQIDGNTARATNEGVRHAGSHFVFSAHDEFVGDLSSRGVARVWSTRSGLQVARFTHTGAQGLLLFADGRMMSASPTETREWRIAADATMETEPQSPQTFSTDGRLMFASRGDHVWSYDVETRQSAMWAEGLGTDVVEVSRDGTFVVTTATPSTRRGNAFTPGNGWTLYRRESDGRFSRVWSLPDQRGSVAFDFTGQYLLGFYTSPFQGGHFDGLVVRASDGSKAASFFGGFRDHALGFTPDSSGVLFSRVGSDVEIVPLDGSRPQPSGFANSKSLEGAVFSADGRRLYTSETDTPDSVGRIRVWDYTARRQVRQIHCGTQVRLFAISPGESAVATVGGDRVVRVCDLKTGDEIVQFTEQTAPTLLRFQGDDEHLILVGGQGIRYKTWNRDELISGLCQRLGGEVRQPPASVVLPASRQLPAACGTP